MTGTTMYAERVAASAGPLYVYGVMGAVSQAPFRGTPLEGHEPIDVIAAGGLSAIVSVADGSEILPNRRSMLAHTRVLEEALERGPVVPMRFGCVFNDGPGVVAFLVRNARALREMLSSINGRVELSLKAFWQEEDAVAAVALADPSIRRLRDHLAALPPSQTYQERVELGRAVAHAVEAERSRWKSLITAALAPIADAVEELPVYADRMIVNAAFLVRREREQAFDAAVAALDEQHGKTLLLKYVGPVPPYSFVGGALE